MTITVGQEEKAYTIHKDLICGKIPYFAKEFEGSFSEAQTGKMHLPDVSTEAFEVILQWLYCKTFPMIPLVRAINKHGLRSISPILQAYIAAESWCVVSLQNDLMDNIANAVQDEKLYFYISPINFVYQHTHDTSRIRKFLVALTAYYMQKQLTIRNVLLKQLEEQEHGLSVRLVIDLAVAILQLGDKDVKPWSDTTKWHVPSGEKCEDSEAKIETTPTKKA